MMKKHCALLAIMWAPLGVQAQQADAGSAFVNGIARVSGGGQTWYIDSTGHKTFDPPAAVQTGGNTRQVTRKGNRYGVLGPGNRWVLPPEYDEIDTKWGSVWLVKKNGKTGWADTSGRVLLPPQFEDAGYLDGARFDVKQNGKWGIYDAPAKQMLIPAVYEGFDYCGGCGRKSDYVYAKKNGKWGVIDFAQKVLAPFEYDHTHSRMRSDNWVTSFTRGNRPVAVNLATGKEFGNGEVIGAGLLAYAGKNGKGLVNQLGEEVLPAVYEDVMSCDAEFAPATGYLTVLQKGRWGLADESGKLLVQPRYDEALFVVFDSLFITRENGLEVLLNAAGKHLLPDGCTDLEVLRPAAAVAYRRNGKYGVYQAATGRLTPAVYDEINEQYYGPAWLKSCVIVVKDGWSGLLGPDGREAVPPQFDEKFHMEGEGGRLIVVQKGARKGLYNTEGRMVAPTEYDDFRSRLGDPSLLIVTKEEGDGLRYGIIDSTGAAVAPVRYNAVQAVSDLLVLLERNGTWEVMNTSTRQTYALPAAEAVFTVNAHTLLVQQAEGHFLFDLRRRKPSTPVYKYIGEFRNGTAVASLHNKKGMIDAAGRVLLPLEYDACTKVTPGIMLIAKGGRYGFADSTGKVIVPLAYDYNPDGFGREYLRGAYLRLERINEDGAMRTGLADLSGRVVVEPAYEAVLHDEAGQAFIVMKNRRFGVVTANGQLAVPVIYDDVIPATMNRFAQSFTFSWPLLCRKGDTYLYVTRNGKELPLQLKSVIRFDETGW